MLKCKTIIAIWSITILSTLPIDFLKAESSKEVLYSSDTTNENMRIRCRLSQDRQVLDIWTSPRVQETVTQLRRKFEQSDVAQTTSGRMTIPRAVDALTLSGVEYALSEDGARPRPLWGLHAERRWFGVAVPQSGYGLDNPDNFYRFAAIDGASAYEITGRFVKPTSSSLTFQIYSPIPGVAPKGMAVAEAKDEGGDIAASLRSENMKMAPDGSFRVIISPMGTTPPGPNVIMHNVDSGLLYIRDSLSSWDQNVTSLQIRRIAGPEKRAPTSAELAERASDIGNQIANYWLNYLSSLIYSQPVNTVILRDGKLRARAGGWGFINLGHFDLKNDEGLVIRMKTMDAKYMAIQVADPWGPSLDYVSRTGSYNLSQSVPDADGVYSFVISPRDAGIYNWVDTSGLNSGTFAIRWQAVPGKDTVNTDASKAIDKIFVTKLSELKKYIPSAKFVNQSEREAQIRSRQQAYGRILAASPCQE